MSMYLQMCMIYILTDLVYINVKSFFQKCTIQRLIVSRKFKNCINIYCIVLIDWRKISIQFY